MTDDDVSARATVRTVSIDDLDVRASYALWRLRQQVFVVEQGSPYPDLDGRDLDPSTRHLLLEVDGELVGCLRLLEEGDYLRIGRVVVSPAHREQGLAARLVDEAMALAGDREVRLDAQVGLVPWYARWGFTPSGPEFDEDGVWHRPMVRPAR
ncbi:GNAT family N-acetyltransferase [Nocardioides gansuensis]|uniref:GNAT family N-acetyltransferase n=1 Tax=Nocardioides gansuensis TaxID=2138300 RepID=A0A2T8F9S5_9ACTN|nr:GNAT family N-acetyltransferase [Nocardioides gansuensis]PVG82445.1 GNAT family N-acetyltransferase [Nocardioides gansuensis]